MVAVHFPVRQLVLNKKLQVKNKQAHQSNSAKNPCWDCIWGLFHVPMCQDQGPANGSPLCLGTTLVTDLQHQLHKFMGEWVVCIYIAIHAKVLNYFRSSALVQRFRFESLPLEMLFHPYINLNLAIKQVLLFPGSITSTRLGSIIQVQDWV